jgi:hypothetical protein
MAILLAAVGGLSAIVLIALVVAFGRRLSALNRALTALQREMLPALEEIKRTSEETQRLAGILEERARALRPDDG